MMKQNGAHILPLRGRHAPARSGAAGIGAALLLALWCLLPVGMCLYIYWMGLHVRFPAPAVGNPAHGDAFLYAEELSTYISAMRLLGALTFAFSLALLLVCLPRVLRLRRDRPWVPLLFVLLVWAAVCTVLSGDPRAAFLGHSGQYNGLSSMLIYAGIFLCASAIRDERARRWLLCLFCAVVCGLAVLMLLQRSGNEFIDYCFPQRNAAVFNQFNHFGYVLCMGITVFAGLFHFERESARIWRSLCLAGLGFLTYTLLRNNTLGALLACALALPCLLLLVWVRGEGRSLHALFPMLVFGVMAAGAPLPTAALLALLFFGLSFLRLRLKPAALIALVLLAAAGLGAYVFLTPFAPDLRKNFAALGRDLLRILSGGEELALVGTGRGEHWRDTLHIIVQNPVFGIGPDGFAINVLLRNNQNPHNEYLMAAGMLGLPGLALYLAALLSLAWRQLRQLRKLEPMVVAAGGAALAYLFSAFVGNPIFNTAPYFWMLLGLCAAGGGEDAALLDPGAPELAARRTRRRLALAAAAWLLCCSALALLCVRCFRGYTEVTELDRELEDIKTMRTAKLMAVLLLDEEDWSEGGSFWYDAQEKKMLPGSDPPPQWRGSGTRLESGALAVYSRQYGSLPYDEATDYRGKLLRFVCTGTAEEPGFTLEWADAEP